jgi:hypothetical protein
MAPTTEQQTAPATEQPTTPATTPTAAEQQPEKLLTQAEFDAALKDRLARAATKAEKERASAEESARLKALEEAGEHKKLAEERATALTQREKELAEAMTKIEQGARATAALTKMLESQLADVPEHIRSLMVNMSPADQLEWLAANKDKLKAAPEADQKQVKQIPGTPKQPDAKTLSESEQEKQRALHAKSVRGMF